MPVSQPERTPGHATPEGTLRYAARFAGKAAAGHFRTQQELQISSLGIGTYLGELDAATDRAYTEAIVAAAQGGINVIDTAINYRLQRSERSVGAALRELAKAGFAREEFVVCTKAGFLTTDGTLPADPSEYFLEEFIKKNIFRVEEVTAGCHCLAPAYLADQLERSLRNLGLACVDVFYLHNPETQLGEISREEFRKRMTAAFEFLETAAAQGKIRMYGIATWNALRQETTARDYISLEEVAGWARTSGGEGHHFRFVQLPFSLAMSEALMRANQTVGEKTMAAVQAARALGVTLVASAPLVQGQLTQHLPAFVSEALGLASDAERALQFARSAPGVTAALVGMSRVEHVRANLELIAIPPASREEFLKMFARK
ncbi:MAG: aldo/keto reductase [Candidatus Acidiferrales bacterium]